MNPFLDNPIWSALTTGSARFSSGNEKYRLLIPEMGFFAGLPDYHAENLSYLATQIQSQTQVILFTPGAISLGEEWEVMIDRELMQMVCERDYTGNEQLEGVECLKVADIPEMLTLTDLTKPGPFLSKTFDFGGYLGIKKGGKLASMAGYRLQPGNFTEISAVCTHPDYLGQGLSKKVMSQLLQNLQLEGQTPFLHLYSDNYPALELYKRLGFAPSNLLRVYRLKKH